MLDGQSLVISEIMYHPASEIDAEEFVELYNAGLQTVDLTGWQISDGVDFIFPAVSIAPGEYLVVAADVAVFATKYPGVSNVGGGWSGQLSNGGERIELEDELGRRVDRVRYADQGDWAVRDEGPLEFGFRGWEWNAAHDGLGKSVELINVAASNNPGQNWAASIPDEGTPDAAVTGAGASDLELSGSGAGGASVGAPTDRGTNVWVFPLSGLSAGTVDVDLAPDEDDITYASGGEWVGLKEWSFTVSAPAAAVYALSA